MIKEPWYFVFSGFLLLSLMIGFIISSFRNDFHRKLSITKFRMLLAGVVIVGTFPLLNYLFGFLLLAQLFFVFPCAIAMCCLTRNLKMFPVALLVSISTYFVQGLELLLMSPFEPCFKKISITFLADLDSILLFANYSLTFGFWLIWRAKRVKE
ncbi:MAG TPA: hypothetical protein PKY59_09690 [Pyrinomonadaceae bacterium]|nr:hypothetical protein [Pyrinomonadaceae bacterium]